MATGYEDPNRVIDLRSDTITQPTPEMRRAMAEADVGDDVFGEDPSVNRLQELAANITGKEASLLVVSGSMGNLISALTWCNRGDELILGAQDHLLINEMGAVTALGAIELRAVETTKRKIPKADHVSAAVHPQSGLFPRTGLISIENTHNRGNGAAFSVEEMSPVIEVAQIHSIPLHMDGARLFNAAVSLGVTPAELTAPADSVTFCLSKGLGCPIGSLLCGSREFINRALRIRKTLGGGMRQAGIIAAPGIWALGNMIDRLSEDHHNARRLAKGLALLPGIEIDPTEIETNIVYIEMPDGKAANLSEALSHHGVRVIGRGTWVRFVTHYGISADDIDHALNIIESTIRNVPVST
jgi:threonine aldolase